MKAHKEIAISLIDCKDKLIHIYSGLTLQQIAFSQNIEWPFNKFKFVIPFPELKAISLYIMEKKMRYNSEPFSWNEASRWRSLSFFDGIHELL